MVEDARRFDRYEVDIPCTVSWKERPLQARLANLSYAGARVTKTVTIPPKDARVSIAFESNGQHLEVMALLTSRVVYSGMRIMEGGEVGYFGVEFDPPPEEVRTGLSSIFESVENRPPEVDWSFVPSVGTCQYCRKWSSMICTVCAEALYVCQDCTTRHLETHLSQ